MRARFISGGIPSYRLLPAVESLALLGALGIQAQARDQASFVGWGCSGIYTFRITSFFEESVHLQELSRVFFKNCGLDYLGPMSKFGGNGDNIRPSAEANVMIYALARR